MVIVISACLLLLPVAAMAGHRKAHGPSKAAIAACSGKTAGTAVEMKGRKKGSMIAATCQEVNGKLVAVPNPPAAKAAAKPAAPAQAAAPAESAAPAQPATEMK